MRRSEKDEKEGAGAGSRLSRRHEGDVTTALNTPLDGALSRKKNTFMQAAKERACAIGWWDISGKALLQGNWMFHEIAEEEQKVCVEEPGDLHAHASHGLECPFNEAGFKAVRIKPLSGFRVTFGQELIRYSRRSREGGWVDPLWWAAPFLETKAKQPALSLYMIASTVRRSPRGCAWSWR